MTTSITIRTNWLSWKKCAEILVPISSLLAQLGLVAFPNTLPTEKLGSPTSIRLLTPLSVNCPTGLDKDPDAASPSLRSSNQCTSSTMVRDDGAPRQVTPRMANPTDVPCNSIVERQSSPVIQINVSKAWLGAPVLQPAFAIARSRSTQSALNVITPCPLFMGTMSRCSSFSQQCLQLPVFNPRIDT